MKIWHVIPWTNEKNLGGFYNAAMNLVEDEDWICFLDGDAVHTTTYFGKYIEEIIEKNPEYGMFTCRTNKILCHYQLYDGFVTNQDMNYHRKIGEEAWEKDSTQVLDVTKEKNKIGGVFLCVSKKSWKIINGFKEERMLGIDNDAQERCEKYGLKLGLMLGIYVQHWYRGDDIKNKEHLL